MWDAFIHAGTLAETIRNYRLYAKITQQELADAIGCSKTQITRIETGRYHEIKSNRYAIALRNHIAKVTGVLVDTSAIDKYQAQCNSKTGVRGVCYIENREKFVATLSCNGKQYNLGKYDTMEEAILIRKRAELIAVEGAQALSDFIVELRQTKKF